MLLVFHPVLKHTNQVPTTRPPKQCWERRRCCHYAKSRTSRMGRTSGETYSAVPTKEVVRDCLPGPPMGGRKKACTVGQHGNGVACLPAWACPNARRQKACSRPTLSRRCAPRPPHARKKYLDSWSMPAQLTNTKELVRACLPGSLRACQHKACLPSCLDSWQEARNMTCWVSLVPCTRIPNSCLASWPNAGSGHQPGSLEI